VVDIIKNQVQRLFDISAPKKIVKIVSLLSELEGKAECVIPFGASTTNTGRCGVKLTL